MATNKVIYAGRTLIDLTGDTVTEDKILNGFTAHKNDGTQITGTCDFDVNSEDATVQVAEMLVNKTAYARGVKLTGTMPNVGGAVGKIKDKTESYTIPKGYHDGSGKVSIAEEELAKIIATNIREGITILGVLGTMNGMEGERAQSKTITPTTEAQTVLPDEGYTCLASVVVNGIPYVESDNAAGGTTITIG